MKVMTITSQQVQGMQNLIPTAGDKANSQVNKQFKVQRTQQDYMIKTQKPKTNTFINQNPLSEVD